MPSNDYIFRSPFASSIYPIGSPDETVSLLFMINASRPPLKRLPIEILLHVNKEIHENAVWEDIRDNWSPFTGPVWLPLYNETNDPLETVRLDLDKRRYYIPEQKYPPFKEPADRTSLGMLSHHISSADLLYRLRCCFPEINVDGFYAVWKVDIRHNISGMVLRFSDCKGVATIHACYDGRHPFIDVESPDSKHMLEKFPTDTVRLLNVLFETVGESQQFKFYHPAAYADLTNDERYIALPLGRDIWRAPMSLEDYAVYDIWHCLKALTTDLSSFSSLLQDLKYDIKSKKIDRLNGTASLTTVISSALLFYRLLWKYPAAGKSNISRIPPITSVWQVQLTHYKTGTSIIFMDDRGLFDIRVNDGAAKAISKIESLIESLCGETFEC